jgi:hypothetical protein
MDVMALARLADQEASGLTGAAMVAPAVIRLAAVAEGPEAVGLVEWAVMVFPLQVREVLEGSLA